MKLISISALLLSVVSAGCPYQHFSKRQETSAGSASQKLNETWAEIMKAKGTQADFYFSAAIRLLRSDMAPTIDHVGDKMPDGRLKFLNTIGVVAKAVFESVPNTPYTGVFKGSQHVIVRPSIGSEIQKKESSLLPGVAMKFFRNGRPSANFVAMYALTNQDSFNFFANGLSNHVPTNNLNGLLTQGYKKFSSVTEWPGFVGLSDMATYGNDGSKVAKPVFPFQLILMPKASTPAVNDGKTDLFDSLTAIKKGTVLWQMYGNDCPFCPFKLMGTIKTDSEMIKSKYADTELFFKHQRFEEDLQQRPDWLKQCATDRDCDSCLGTKTCKFE